MTREAVQGAVALRVLFGRHLSLLGCYMETKGELLEAVPFPTAEIRENRLKFR